MPSRFASCSAMWARGGAGRRGLQRAGDDADQLGEGRIAVRAAALELGLEEAVGVVAGGGDDRGRVRRVGLHEHAAAARAASGAAGELGDQRERALLGAEVGEAQRRVGVEHDAERDVREVVALGHHLRAEQQAGGGGLEAGRAARGRRPCWPRCRRRGGRRGRRARPPARPRRAPCPRRGGRPRASRTRRSGSGRARGGRSDGTRALPRRGAGRARRRSWGTPTPSRSCGR